MDCRFHLKATFEIYGQEFEWDTSLNWSADAGEIDQRITDWFLECYEKADAKNAAERRERERDIYAAMQEEHERSELRRLKEKYEPRTKSQR
jgi:hypothetical protein